MTQPERIIGHVRLLSLLGSGGMGDVWEGRDERLDRRVAVKAIRRRWQLDERARRRFAREARLLSRLEHPNICRLYELLHEGDDDYLVMELVRGRSLRQAMDEGLTSAERLEVALGIGAALAAAHALSIVHRDLKPDNVMLGEEGTAKVLDFGLARTGDEPGDDSGSSPPPGDAADGGLTQDGEVLGTPRAMSPEQARGEPATAASDMYAFGLILYELYTGRPPYGGDANAATVLQRAMWADVPPPGGIDRQVAGLVRDLLQLDPQRRPTSEAALERLRAVRERPLRRLRWGAAAVVTASLVAATAVSLVALDRARAEAAAAQATTEFLAALFRGSDADQGGLGPDATARDIVKRGAQRLEEELSDQPRARAQLLLVLGEIQGNLGLGSDSQALLEEALTVQEGLSGSDGAELVPILSALANAHAGQAHLDQARQVLERALAIARRRLPQRRTAALLSRLGSVYQRMGRLDEAERAGREAVATWLDAVGTDDPEWAAATTNLALVLIDRGEFEEADGMLAGALAVSERHLAPDHPDIGRILGNLGTTRKELGRYDEAEVLCRRALALLERRLGAEHPQVALQLNNLGVVLFEAGRYRDAEQAYRRAVEAAEVSLGPDHPYTAIWRGNLAEACHLDGRAAEAEPLYRGALAVVRGALGPEHPAAGEMLRGLARVVADLGRAGEAEQLMLEAIRVREVSWGPQHPETGKALGQLGGLYLRWGRADEAAAVLERARAILVPALGADHPAVRALPPSPRG